MGREGGDDAGGESRRRGWGGSGDAVGEGVGDAVGDAVAMEGRWSGDAVKAARRQ